MGVVGAAGSVVNDDGMEDFEIDAFDPIERCRRGRAACGVDDDPRVDDQVAGLSEDMDKAADSAQDDRSQ